MNEKIELTDMDNESVKVTLDVPKVLRMKIRIVAAEKDRTVAAEIRDTLTKCYLGGEPEMACSEA